MLDLQFGPMLAGLLFAVAIGVVIYTLASPYLSGEKAVERRIEDAIENRSGRIARRASTDQASNRKKAVADTIKELEQRQRLGEKVSLGLRLERAGLDISPQNFWMMSLICGVVATPLAFLLVPGIHPVAAFAVGFVTLLGLPRWVVAHLTKRRQKKFVNEFANAIDIIVRGVKSGLPLLECLQIIARESPEPIRTEFRAVVEQQRLGVPLQECFERMMSRLPLPEVKFFAIVIGIQQSAGGNLSEALGNLASVLRDRKQMSAKIQALSAEAKASAGVLAFLPFAVTSLLYLTAPNYVEILWTTTTGKFQLLTCAVLMLCGTLVMRKMINFKF
jgi:tight adherence protein B